MNSFSYPIAAAALPSNVEAEQAILGVLMFDSSAWEELGSLAPEHFLEPFHVRLFTAMREMRAADRLLAPPLLAPRFRDDPAFVTLGGLGYLLDLCNRAPPPSVVRQFALSVADAALRRGLIQVAAEVIESARSDHARDGVEIVADLERKATELAQGTTVADAFVGAGDAVTGALKHALARTGRIDFPFGVAEVDAATGGMTAGETTVLGAWTGMGKTLCALTVAKACAQAGAGVAYFSLEMSANPMALRLACDLAYQGRYEGRGPEIDRATRGELRDDEWAELWAAERQARELPLLFDTRPGLTTAQIEAATRRQHRRWGREGVRPGPVIVDHIGRVRAAITYRGDPTAETTEITHDLDAMAKRLGVPVVQLAQLNRSADLLPNTDKRPQLSHLKQASAIEQAARQVILLHRPEYYHREPMEHESQEAKIERLEMLEKVRGHLYWIIAKNSQGPRSQVLTYCDAACNAVRSWPG